MRTNSRFGNRPGAGADDVRVGIDDARIDDVGIDVIERLDAAATALAHVDLSVLSDAAIEESFSVLSVTLCRVDVLLSRLADENRCRDAASFEFPWFGVNPADVRRTDAEVARMDALPLAG